MARPTRESLALDHIEDVFGDLWLVAEYRPTAHGFDIAIGWPDDSGKGGVRVALTAALAEYFQSIERPRDINLPVSLTTTKALRKSLGLRYDREAWWTAREADLRSMTIAAFAARHHCSAGAACQRRRAMLANS